MEPLRSLQTKLNEAMPQLDLRVGEPMARHTTFRVGGPAALMALPKGEEEVRQVIRLAWEAGVPPFFLGKGSNLLVADGGVDRFLVKLPGALTRLERDGARGLYAGSGVSLAQAAVFAAEAGLTGLEFAHGIPGSLGGGVFMNAGAYDGELAQVVDWVDCLDETGAPHRLAKADLALGYRTSVFAQKPWLILGAHLTLAPGDPAAIRKKMADLARRRRAKQPLEYPSAGSTFKRPPGHFAGALIEGCGLKGCRVGGAQVSEKHAGFVVNTGGATCQDILDLIHHVRSVVLAQTGVLLEPEVRLLGGTFREP
ncbi:MAG TPA: UDP-N-acetylmuramate dehydrogenase [Candidatus Evtepia faecavium]|nr:UDP-N-acetylmuramate dehydrogenase [Candidatus Evtepia faecavium]